MKRSALSRLRHFFARTLEGSSREVFNWKEFWKHYAKGFYWILILTVAVLFLESAGVLNGFETVWLDNFLRLNDRKVSEQVVIVEITDEDYMNEELFDGKSPLNGPLLTRLASQVQSYGPAAVGMDFDTESAKSWKLDPATLAAILPDQRNDSGTALRTPIVWAEVPCNMVEPLTLAPVLGGQFRDLEYLGIPRFPVDSDGMVRRYQAKFQATGNFERCPPKFVHTTEGVPDQAVAATATVSSFARAVTYQACKSEKIDYCSSLRPEESPNKLWAGFKSVLRRVCLGNNTCRSMLRDQEPSVIFNFYGDRYRFPIIQSHEFIGQTAQALLENKNLQSRRAALLHNKIVLIGGSFNSARDVYMTPLGQMAGVELIALAVQSDFGGGIRETQKILEIFADIFVGSFIVFLYFYYQRRPLFAFYASLFGVPVLALLFSLVLFKSAAYWFNFAPIVIGMVMHELLELSKACGELQHEVHKLKRKLDESTEHSFRKIITQVPQEAVTRQEKIEPPVGEQPNTKV